MSVHEVFIFKPHSVNAFPSSAIIVYEITTLRNESRYNSVEEGAFEMESFLRVKCVAFLSSTEGTEVLRSARSIGLQLNYNPACLFSTNRYIEKDCRVRLNSLIFLAN